MRPYNKYQFEICPFYVIGYCTTNNTGIVQIVNGAGGHYFGKVKGSPEPYEDITLQEYGISKLDVVDKCKLVIHFISSSN